ncbi:ATP-binding protein [Nocardia sp. CA-136227]|uniref:ATP-binding protein n=1 Tax=Nocardia sp. CA-136227 TaxID=3239979 RepID=UPI003D97A870
MALDLADLVAHLRATGGDDANIEVKSAAGGLPESLTSTLSALANHPGGGTIILGLDERKDFSPVTLLDPQTLKQGLAKKARSLEPPIQLTIEDGMVEGETVIVATVHECDPSAKPCRVAATGHAYVRGYDGDFQMSGPEVQAFLAARKPPHFDRAAVPGATIEDLDRELVDDFTRTVRLRDRRGLGRFEGNELLRRAGVIDKDGTPTVAGLLALGTYPQQWFPRLVIQAAADPSPADPPGTRARNQVTISGPIPHMLDAAMEWAEQTFDTRIFARRDGTVVDIPAYPLVAFRELIANALLHRDLDCWSRGMAVEVRLRRDRLVVTNPGGLYGITADRLGKEAVTSARNMWLVHIAQYLRSPESGGRVIEALATGIPTIARALGDSGLPPAQFSDAGIRFTAVLRPAPFDPFIRDRVARRAPKMTLSPETRLRITHQAERVQRLRQGDLTATQKRIVDLLREQPLSVSELQPRLELSRSGVRKALSELRTAGIVEQIGGRGQRTHYQLADPPRAE